jgi:site-specific recombinase XerD
MKRFPPHPLTKPQAQALIRVAMDGTEVGVRNRAICTMLYRTGARCRELCEMMLSDVYPLSDGCMMVRIRMPKGYARGVMPREVGMDHKAGGFIWEWMAVRGVGDGPLFITRSGLGVLPSYIRQLLPRLADRASIKRRVHPHAFRHTFAKELYEEGVGVVEIMMAMGHTSLSTTQEYLRHIGATEVVNTTRNRRW